jgi:ABC-2 type transport system permease protein
MTDVLKYEARKRLVGTLALGSGIGAFALLIVFIFPSIQVAGDSIEAYVEALPDAIREGFGIQSISTIEGFLATEIYQFVWVLMLGLYIAYLAGGIVASDVESRRIDLVLATPVSRKRVLVEKFGSVLVPIVVLNLIVPLFVYAGTLAIAEPLAVADLVALHVLSVPYLLVTAAIGLALSVLVGRADVAQRGSLAVIFVLFVVDSVTGGSDVEWLGAVSPTNYFSPSEILVEGTHDIAGAAILLLAAFALLVVCGEWFERMDV